MAVIYAIPGFACTEKLFQKLKLNGHELRFLKWPHPEKHYDMETYADQFLPQINTNEKFSLLGVSFGGMLCAELAEKLNPERTIIISGCVNRTELPFMIMFLKIFPMHLLLTRKMHIALGSASGWLVGFKGDVRGQLKEMMKQMPPRYFQRCASYIINWKRKENKAKFVRIHGDADRLLWHGNIEEVEYTIQKGTHAAIIYRADEISRIIEKLFLKT